MGPRARHAARDSGGLGCTTFFAKWDGVAKTNARLKNVPDEMTGEGVIPFDRKSIKAEEQKFINPVLTEM